MANLSITVTNSLTVLGSPPSNLWNDLVWGTDDWGYSDDLITSFDKGIANGITLTDAIGKQIDKITLTDSITFSGALESIFKSIGVWKYNFVRPTIDGDEAVYDESTKVTDPSSDWTKVSDGSTNWR